MKILQTRKTYLGASVLVTVMLTLAVDLPSVWGTSLPRPSDSAGDAISVAVVEGAPADYRISLDDDARVGFTLPELTGHGLPDVETSMVDGGWRHVRLRWQITKEVAQDELAVAFDLGFEPDFWWAPHLAPYEGYVVAQHVFRAPALIVQRGTLTFIVVPDLDTVGRRAANPWFMDYDATRGMLWLGMVKTEVPEHVLFRKTAGMTFDPGALELSFFVGMYRDLGEVRNPWARAAEFLWRRWAKPLYDRGEPISAALETYIHRTYDWAFNGWGDFVWQEFSLGDTRVGAPQFIVNVSQSPNYPGPWFQREFLSIWNQAWFSSLRSASGLFRHARARNDAERLVQLQDAAGFFPGWLHPETHEPGPVMNQTPETSLSITFLLKLAEATGEARFRNHALRALDAVLSQVVPEGLWLDFETFWSCCRWGQEKYLNRKIERNALHKHNTLGIFWTAEALLEAYRATGQARYLDWGRRTLDELSLSQQVWQPPFIHVPALGGFGVMNADGEWNDSRQTLFAGLFLEYYRETGHTDYFERGVAALHAGFIMMYCPENPAVKAMWEKVYPWFGPEDYGFTMENYGHGGRTSPEGEGMGVFTIYDWGNGAAAEAAGRILGRYGQVYLDRARNRAFGLDQVEVRPANGEWELINRTGKPRVVRVVCDDGSSFEVRLEETARIR